LQHPRNSVSFVKIGEQTKIPVFRQFSYPAPLAGHELVEASGQLSASCAEITVDTIPTTPMHNVSIHTASLLPIGTSPFIRFRQYFALQSLR
jgi:hypothetical protein